VTEFATSLKEKSGVDVGRCFQCRKCSSGCPVVEYMDVPPARMIRMILAGQAEKVLSSKTIWLCASCYTCSTRCPNDIDFARVADALRTLVVREGRAAAVEKIETFHKAFMDDVRRRGRVHEPMFLAFFKMKTMDLLSDMELGIAMFFKGKLPFFPHGVKDRKSIKKAFELEDAKKEARK
jgi:heterodisulfide reductase subunit C